MDNRAATLALALRHHEAARHGEAEALYRHALENNPSDPAALYLYALLLIERREFDKAREKLCSVIALRPDAAEAHLALARLLTLRGEDEAALAPYRQAMALRPDDVEPALGLARALSAVGEHRAALAQCRATHARWPHLAAAHEALASIRLAAGQTDDAAASFRTAVTLEPKLAIGWIGLARSLLCLGRPTDAMAAIGTLLEIDSLAPEMRAEAWFLRGTAYKLRLEYPAAIAGFERAILANPLHAAAHLNLGNCFAACERWQVAERHLRRALSLDPSLKEAHASLGSVLLRTGAEAWAEQSCREALALDPAMVAAHQNLAAICQAANRTAEAAAHRDAAYRKQCMFVEAAAEPSLTVLMPTTAESGNVPTKFLFPRDRYTLLKWFIEYATSAQEAEFPPYDIVFNGIGDPDMAGPTAQPLARFLQNCRRPIINHPACIPQTRRDRLPSLLAGIPNLVVAEVVRLDQPASPHPHLPAFPLLEQLSPPLLLRGAGSHGGQGVRLIESAAMPAATKFDGAHALYATRFWPYRSADGYHRKYRMILIARKPYPCHLALSRHWLVHYITADMLSDPAKCREEQRLLDDPEAAIGAAAMAAISTIGERLDLDFAGVDFSLLPDGRVLVFEANATMLVHPEDETGPFAYKNPAVRAIFDAFAVMLAVRLGTRTAAFSDSVRNDSSQTSETPSPRHPARALALWAGQ